jgi:hypothetical protein
MLPIVNPGTSGVSPIDCFEFFGDAILAFLDAVNECSNIFCCRAGVGFMEIADENPDHEQNYHNRAGNNPNKIHLFAQRPSSHFV